VGVDVEQVSMNLRRVEGQFSSPREREWLRAAGLEGEAYDAALARIWTAKEAIVKLRRSTFAEMLANAEPVSIGTQSSEYVMRDSGEKVTVEHRSHSGYMFSVAMFSDAVSSAAISSDAMFSDAMRAHN
jgi:phosphopantetheinyl transferase